MVRPAPSLVERARGTLLAALAAGGAPAAAAGDAALATALAEVLLQEPPDFERLARRWAEVGASHAASLDEGTRGALAFLRAHGLPPDDVAPPVGASPVARAFPVALRAWRSPRHLLAGTLAQATLTHPDPAAAWAAVALNVALACLLAGRLDLIPEVLEALRNNDAHREAPDVYETVERVPLLLRRDEVEAAGPAETATGALRWALWSALREPKLERGLAALADAPGAAMATGALLGARDGELAVPAPWIEAIHDHPRLVGLAEALAEGRTAAG
ncbi:MAG: ADP-ribosylglycohydrolase family protein [Gemmatimonadales bacterium]|nr:ADP-ribosylglycohydrolase family protein [Gemmatimonadales bacterium]